MVVENLYMVIGNPYMVVRGRAEYRRSPSGAREMCVPTGPAGEMCVPKPFSCFVLFCFVWLLYAKNQRPAPPVNIAPTLRGRVAE